MKQLFTTAATIALASVPFFSDAMPAKPVWTTFTQSDGTEITARLRGDENFHFYETPDGRTLKRVGDDFSEQPLQEAAAVATKARRMMPVRRASGLIPGETFPSKGKQKAVAVLVEYQDVKFTLDDPKDYFTRMLNEEGFSDYHATGSARDFFINSSYGQFEPEFDVFGPVTLMHERAFYGGNDSYYGQDNAPQKMVIEACRQLNPDVDFSQYDRDGDGYIDNVFVFYAGRGEASGGEADCVWPHAWTIDEAEPSATYMFDGVRLNRYACSNEWEMSDYGGERPVGVGTFIHEFSHVMGLPDLYSTQYVPGTFTPGEWSAMDYGPYNNDGCTPPQYSVFERYALGYIDPAKLEGADKNVAMMPIETGDAFIIPTERENEYYMIENRQLDNVWDNFLPWHGMLVWHIDYDPDVWEYNCVNNTPSHYYVDLIEADGVEDSSARSGNPFPGASDITSYSPRSWAGLDLGVQMTDITERYSRIVFRLNGGAPAIGGTTVHEARDVTANAFTASWDAVPGAECYELSVFSLAGDSDTYGEYERYEVGDATSWRVTGLTPSTTYYYNVVVDDGFFGSEMSADMPVTTLDPTFDYFAPVATAATDVKSDSFTANWETMADAREYYLTVYKKIPGDCSVDKATFDGSAIPEGWSTTAKDFYGMAGYSGEAVPALRMSVDNQSVSTPVYPADIVVFSFWHRGNGISDAEASITVDAAIYDDELASLVGWETLGTFPITCGAGGKTLSFDDLSQGVRQICITLGLPGAGALAVDDICVNWGVTMTPEFMAGYESKNVGDVTSCAVSGLEPGQAYYYTVVANDGRYFSLVSNEIEVVTTGKAGVVDVASSPRLDVAGLTVSSDVGIAVYDVYGRFVGAGRDVAVPSAGVYVVKSAGNQTCKLLVTK